MHIALVGTYPPTSCGIATFTADVERSLAQAGVRVTVVPVHLTSLPGPRADRPFISRDDRATYAAAARSVNRLDCDAVLIQHEFGIFGGPSGEWLLDFVNEVKVPTTVSLHTVLGAFNTEQRDVLGQLLSRCALATVFTETARDLIVRQFSVPDAVMHVVAHGAPTELFGPVDIAATHRRLDVPPQHPVVSTFGLLSPGKGIEHALRALADPRLDSVHYVIAGRTHPEIVRCYGEQYRDQLTSLSVRLGIDDRVRFVNEFLSIDDLAALLRVTTAFCTPYLGEEQSVSGALSFALAAGCPAVSTPYRYACDMLANGAGLVVPFGDVDALAGALHTMCFDDTLHRRAARAARQISTSSSWPHVGRRLSQLLATALSRATSLAEAG